MSWTEREVATGKEVDVTADKARMLDEVRKSSLPIVQKESESGVRPFETVKLQPVKGIGTFEAEFGLKGDDVIFHFWPYGYHDADRNEGMALPQFPKNFMKILNDAMAKVFNIDRVELALDADVGAWFVKAKGYAQNQFHRNLCIEAVTVLHRALGGSES